MKKRLSTIRKSAESIKEGIDVDFQKNELVKATISEAIDNLLALQDHINDNDVHIAPADWIMARLSDIQKSTEYMVESIPESQAGPQPGEDSPVNPTSTYESVNENVEKADTNKLKSMLKALSSYEEITAATLGVIFGSKAEEKEVAKQIAELKTASKKSLKEDVLEDEDIEILEDVAIEIGNTVLYADSGVNKSSVIESIEGDVITLEDGTSFLTQ